MLNRSVRAALALALAAASVAACQPTGAVPVPTPLRATSSAAPAPLSQKEQLLLALNEARADAGLPPLRLRREVADVARRWAAQLAREGALRHRPGLHAALVAEGMTPAYWAENVGVGGHVRQVQDAFMASPPHRANILDARFSEVGIGATAAGGRVWVTVDFTG